MVVAIVAYERAVVVFRLVHVAHEFLHGVPVVCHNLFVAKLFPYHPRHYHAGVVPSETHHVGLVGAVLCYRCHAGERSCGALCVAHVTHPLVEELACVCEEGAGLGKHLCVSGPSEAFVALRTVCRHGQIVGELSPHGVGDEAVDKFVASGQGACLHVSGYGGDGNRRYALYLHVVGGGDGHQTVAEECVCGHECGGLLRVGEGVGHAHAGVGDAEVEAVDATLGTVHATALGAVAVV